MKSVVGEDIILSDDGDDCDDDAVVVFTYCLVDKILVLDVDTVNPCTNDTETSRAMDRSWMKRNMMVVKLIYIKGDKYKI